MNISINPFQQLYFSDDTQSENNFVELFSDEVLQTAIHPVFQGGNVVLSGTQGCGKTMILSLLRPEIRIAYSKAKKEFPVKKELRNFISAGVNLTRSKITDIVQVTLYRGDEADERELPLYFGDFFNYLIVDDLLDSINVIGSNPEVFDSIVDLSHVEEFVFTLAKQDCWFGYLDGVKTFEQLKERIAQRINFYRMWVNGNIDDPSPPDEIRHSKTNIGEPIARAAECLRQSGMVSDDVPILIRVDQIEELHRAYSDRQRCLLFAFRKMINRVFASRDARVHYRAGTRRYGWNNPEFMVVWGSEARLECRRDYQLIDMDEGLFLRGEVKNTIFERFAIDAFQKRVEYYFRNEHTDISKQLAKSVFGKSPNAHERIAQLNPHQNELQIDRALGLDIASDKEGWSLEWREYLRGIYRANHAGMLDATLAAAWGRQTGGARSKVQHRESPPPEGHPWRERKWWRKERLDQAVLQLMTRCQQRFMWWGYRDITSLSGSNITVFLHICHRIWDGFLKNEDSLPEDRRTDILHGGSIPANIQDAGILFASNEWFNKLPEEPGGNSRKSFVEKLGAKLNEGMMRDLRMSYPGGNGISITLSEFDSDGPNIPELRAFMFEAVGYGVLFETEHSSKSKSSGRRRKFYLNPILCPRFQLPEARTKEPYYWKIGDLLDLAMKAQITFPRRISTQKIQPESLSLFPEIERPRA